MKKITFILSLLLLVAGVSHAGIFTKSPNALTQDKLDSMSVEEAAKAVIDSRDLNGDGMLIKKETNRRFRIRRFKTVDKDLNGKITVEELAEAMSASRKHRQERLNRDN